MTPLRDDYILRAIEKVAAMLRAALGLKQSCEYSSALETLERAEELLLGERAAVIAAVDAATASSLIGDAEALALYAKLFAERAEIQRRSGDTDSARSSESRALELALEAERRGLGADDDLRTLIEILRLREADGRGAQSS
jgi:hypothetical protein